jgi:hypothetical protein
MSYKKAYIHLERLGKTEVEGITIGECYIFPKLDGTNGVIWYEDGLVKAGSRNRELSESSDNQGFLNKFVKDNYSVLNKLLSSNPELILYGEWLVPHTVKNYRDEAWRKFFIFDVYDTGAMSFLHYETYRPLLSGTGLDIIPPLVIIKDPTEEQLWHQVNQNTYMMKAGNFIGEGIVIKNYSFKNEFGRTIWAKLIRPEFKDEHRELSNPNKIINKDGIEELFVKEYFTADQILKEKAKIVNEKGSFDNKDITRLLTTAYYEILRDNLVDFVVKKNSTIDFKVLKIRAFNEIRKHI